VAFHLRFGRPNSKPMTEISVPVLRFVLGIAQRPAAVPILRIISIIFFAARNAPI
jgi:hypothetical protein